MAGESRALWVRDLADERARQIPGTENALFPFWSPDGESIGFGTDKELKRTLLKGAATVTICELPGGTYFGGSWNPDSNSIVFASDAPITLQQVSVRGGSPEPLFKGEEQGTGRRQAVHPDFLPSGAAAQSILFAAGSTFDAEMVVLDLETGEQQILGAGDFPRYSRSGHIIYQTNAREGGLWALPFSIRTLQPTGEAFPIARNAGFPSIADDGTLVYVDFGAVGGGRQLVWMDREGRRLGTVGQPQDGIRNIDLSADETRVAVTAAETGHNEIWVHEVKRPIKTRITFSSGETGVAVSSHWSPSGSDLLFASRREGSQAFDIYVKSADGAGDAKLVFGSDIMDYASDWSADGRYALADQHPPGNAPADVLLLERQDDGRFKGTPLLSSQYMEKAAKLSPDGRHVAYVSDESGDYEVYVQRVPDGGEKLRISVNGGMQPRWSRDGNELFLVDNDALMAVRLEQGERLSAGAPELLFRSPGLSLSPHAHYDVSSDGRFILAEDVNPNSISGSSVAGLRGSPFPVIGPDRIHVVQNWFEEFREK